jgi:hypothetical protein
MREQTMIVVIAKNLSLLSNRLYLLCDCTLSISLLPNLN